MDKKGSFSKRLSIITFIAGTIFSSMILAIMVLAMIQPGITFSLKASIVFCYWLIASITVGLVITYILRFSIGRDHDIDWSFPSMKGKNRLLVLYGLLFLAIGLMYGYVEVMYLTSSKTVEATVEENKHLYIKNFDGKETMHYYFFTEDGEKVSGKEIIPGWEIQEFKNKDKKLFIEYLPKQNNYNRIISSNNWLLLALFVLTGSIITFNYSNERKPVSTWFATAKFAGVKVKTIVILTIILTIAFIDAFYLDFFILKEIFFILPEIF